MTDGRLVLDANIVTAMSCMTAKSFADSNVVIYTIGKEVGKADIARALLAEQQAMSVQVVNECVTSVCASSR